MKKGKHSIWAVVLAAGESKRMNSPKLVLPYRGKTIISYLIGNIRQSNLNGIIVVLGAWKDEITRVAGQLPVQFCQNDNFKEGMLSSVICGIRSLPENTCAAMIFPGDQPEISEKVINAVADSFKKTGKGIIVASYNGKRGHPILITNKYFPEIEKLDPEKGLRGLSLKFPGDVLEVNVDDAMILKDIDTREDYLDAVNKTEGE